MGFACRFHHFAPPLSCLPPLANRLHRVRRWKDAAIPAVVAELCDSRLSLYWMLLRDKCVGGGFTGRRIADNLGRLEREMLMALIGPQPRLDYPTEPLKMANGCVVEKYVIPDADKGKVLKQLFPFDEPPTLDDVRIDIHMNRTFRIRDFIVTREDEGNFFVSPYYAEAGGTVLDWVDDAARSVTVRIIRRPAEAASPQGSTASGGLTV